jgi:hypothetical protein
MNSGIARMSKAEAEELQLVNARQQRTPDSSSFKAPALKVAAVYRTSVPLVAEETGSWRSGESRSVLPSAVFVSYMSGGLIHVGLDNHCAFVFPAHRVEALATARALDLRQIWIESFGQVLHWPRLQTRLSLSKLMQGEFGSPDWMSQQSTTRARPNGQLAAAGRKARAPLQAVSVSA